MQISGTGHWFLEGWIGDHSVEFLLDSGSSVTAMSNSFYWTLIRAGAPLGILGPTARTLRSANGTRIGVSGWQPVPMPLLEQTSWAPCYLTPWTLRTVSSLPKLALLFNCTDETLFYLVVCLWWATVRCHRILKLCYTVLSGLPVVAVCHPVDY